VYSGAVFCTSIYEDGLEELSNALNCVGDCQPVINQDWIVIDFLLFFIPTSVMIILYSNIFLAAKKQAKRIENISSKAEYIKLECPGEREKQLKPWESLW
jgi:trace amine associated receptor